MQQLQKTYRLFVLTALTAGIAIAKQTVPPLSGVVECTAEAAELTGTDSWGGIAPHPAVVNAVCPEKDGSVISLRGDWEFSVQPGSGLWRNGIWRHYYRERWDNARTIQVPGCWEAQGVGEPGMGESWDQKGDHNPKPIRHKYLGFAWYRKSVDIPAAWAGRRIWLKIGGVRSQGWFWVNNEQVAWVDNYCGTYKYEITSFVKPGTSAVVVAQVNNAIPARKGLFSGANRWGGLYRDVEIESTPPTLIDDAWVRGDFDTKMAEAHVTVEGPDANQAEVRLTVDGTTRSVRARGAGETVVKLPLANFRPWHPEHPNLYTGIIELVVNNQVIQRRHERFGVRKLEVIGKEFRLNGRPFYIRGFGDDHVYPITGITPPDRDLHRTHLARAKAAGFNFARLHTHCELPEYFEAADEIGIFIQPELPYYSDWPTEAFQFDPIRDVRELWRHYRRHPSFGVYSMGNEGSFGPRLNRHLHQVVKQMDPDRLKIGQDCHVPAINDPSWSDYLGGPVKEWVRGSYDPDRPFVAHEYLNLCIKLDSRLEPQFTGVWMPPVTRAQRAGWLARFGLGQDWGDRLQDAQHVLQRHWQKSGIETARKDPYCDGYSFWTIVDVVVKQGETYTAQGLLDPFWNEKRNGATLASFRQFNGPVTILMDMHEEQYVYTSGETMEVDFHVVNFGERDLSAGEIKWTLGSLTGTCPLSACPVGSRGVAASTVLIMPPVERPVKLTLAATLECDDAYPEKNQPSLSHPSNFSNSLALNTWEFWVFPKRKKKDGCGIAVEASLLPKIGAFYDGLVPAETGESPIVIAWWKSEVARTALEKGLKVITIAGADGAANNMLGWWWMGTQVGTAFKMNDPALGDLPHEGHLSPLTFRLLKKTALKLPLAGLDERDISIVGEGGDACYLYLGAAKIANGKALMAFGLDILSDTPEGTCVLDGMIRTVRSPAFNPQGTITMPLAKAYNDVAQVIAAGAIEERGLPDGVSRLSVARGLKGKNQLIWRTKPLKAGTRIITWQGGLGYPGQPPASFNLALNGRPLINIPTVVWKDTTWEGNGCTLIYTRDDSTREYGDFELRIPEDALSTDGSATLSVTGSAGSSLSWMGVME